jgi:negative regulator of PHO system
VPKAPRDGLSPAVHLDVANRNPIHLHIIAINLLEHLLQFEPNRRYDALQAMDHPYFTAAPIAPPSIPVSVSSSTASLALPPRVAARASQASAAVAQQQQQQQQAAAAHQQMMLVEQQRQQAAAQGYYGMSYSVSA